MTELDAYEIGYRAGVFSTSEPFPSHLSNILNNILLDGWSDGLIDLKSVGDINYYREIRSLRTLPNENT